MALEGMRASRGQWMELMALEDLVRKKGRQWRKDGRTDVKVAAEARKGESRASEPSRLTRIECLLLGRRQGKGKMANATTRLGWQVRQPSAWGCWACRSLRRAWLPALMSLLLLRSSGLSCQVR